MNETVKRPLDDPGIVATAGSAVAVPRNLPVLVALGLVALLLAATIAVDLVAARRVAHRTAEIVENSQRSVELVDDLREQSHRLVDPNSSEGDLAEVTRRIREDAAAFDPLATSVGEREEWNRLRALLASLERGVGSPGSPLRQLSRDVARSIDQLVVINRGAAHAQAEAIREIHRRAVVADASAGALTLALVTAIALILLRVLRRQRALTARHIELLDERNRALGERNRELDAFAGRAAHDLRGPMNPIRGYADLLLSGKEPPEEVRLMASRIRTSVDRMARVVDDMLELSRAGRPTRGEASPAQVAAEVLEELGPELLGAELRTELTHELVACSPGVLEQILRNLVSNAIKFRSRRRRLVLELAAYSRDGEVELVIADNGVGMDAESAAHAFDAYYRGRTDREVPGYGLGLAIVERATHALGGSCALTSEPDQGTRIVIRLPRIDGAVCGVLSR
jgi:signal transduction histidine kinase